VLNDEKDENERPEVRPPPTREQVALRRSEHLYQRVTNGSAYEPPILLRLGDYPGPN
jgi:hypothetical protein